MQIHSNAYRNPGQLPEGAVLVVGAGSSGAQIADELLRAGRRVYLSVGPHDRPPRRYRGARFRLVAGGAGPVGRQDPRTGHGTCHDRGQRRPWRPDRRFPAPCRARHDAAGPGGTVQATACMHFAPDLARNIAAGDANYLSVLDAADAYVAKNGLDLPEEPEARKIEAGSGLRDRPDPSAEPGRGRDHLDHLGDGLCARFRLAEGRRIRREGHAAASSAASRRCPGFTSWAWPGCRAGRRPSSGASGTMPSIWRSISPRAGRGRNPSARRRCA